MAATIVTDSKELTRFLGEREVSELTGISVKTLQRWRLQGVGPKYRKFIGSVKYSALDIDTWVQSCPSGGGRVA